MEMETESDPIIRYQTLDAKNDTISESIAPLKSVFSIFIPQQSVANRVLKHQTVIIIAIVLRSLV